MTGIAIFEIALILVIIAWNAFFVSAEYAFVAVRRTRIDELVEEGSAAAKRVRRMIDDPARFISAFQLAITLSSLALGAVGEPVVSRAFEELLGTGGALGERVTIVVSVILAFAIISALHVVLGEIVPKTLTLSRAESVALRVALPVSIFMWVFWPFIWVLRGLSEALIRLMGLESPSDMRLVHSEEELKMLISASHEEGVLEAEEQRILHSVFDFSDTEVRQVMIMLCSRILTRVAAGNQMLLMLRLGPLLTAVSCIPALFLDPGRIWITVPAQMLLGIGMACMAGPVTHAVLQLSRSGDEGMQSAINLAAARFGTLLAIALLGIAATVGWSLAGGGNAPANALSGSGAFYDGAYQAGLVLAAVLAIAAVPFATAAKRKPAAAA